MCNIRFTVFSLMSIFKFVLTVHFPKPWSILSFNVFNDTEGKNYVINYNMSLLEKGNIVALDLCSKIKTISNDMFCTTKVMQSHRKFRVLIIGQYFDNLVSNISAVTEKRSDSKILSSTYSYEPVNTTTRVCLVGDISFQTAISVLLASPKYELFMFSSTISSVEERILKHVYDIFPERKFVVISGKIIRCVKVSN